MIRICLLLLSLLLSFGTRAQVVFHENFDAPSFGDSVTTVFNGMHGFDANARIAHSPMFCDSAFIGAGDTIYLKTDPFNTAGFSNLYLTFYHICKIDFFDAATVEVSPDTGASWYTLTTEYLTNALNGGPYCSFPFLGYLFNEASWGNLWQPGNPGAVPENTWWVREVFDLSGWINGGQLMVRFALSDGPIPPGGNGKIGWYIDDIRIGDFPLFGKPFVTRYYNPCDSMQAVSFNVQVNGVGYQATDSVQAHLFFGDGNDTLVVMPWNAGSFRDSIGHAYAFSGQYSIQAVFSSSFGLQDTVTYPNAIQLIDSCMNVDGHAYVDYNSDCLFNGGDEPLRYMRVRLKGTPMAVAYTDQYGFYQFPLVNPGTYDLYPDSGQLPLSFLSYGCPASGKYTVSSVPSTGLDFAMDCSPGFDLASSMYSWYIHPGYLNLRTVLFLNSGCTAMPAQGKLVLDSMTTFVQSDPPPSQVIGDTVIWNLNGLDFSHPVFAFVYYLPDTSLTTGDTLCFISSIGPVAGDMNPLNNVYISCSKVKTSFDPNDKHVDPDGPVGPSQRLTYLVNFQNTGNDTAYKVVVFDTLDTHLDLSTLQIIGSSHGMSIDLFPGGILRFSFPDILLPDSATDEPASHGFVLYSLAPLPGLANGTTIANTAHIFFDFNQPVATNTTLNVIDTALATTAAILSTNEGGITVFPNPADDRITVESNQEALAGNGLFFELFDVMGNRIMGRPVLSERTIVDISRLAGGVYLVRVRGNGRTLASQRLLVY